MRKTITLIGAIGVLALSGAAWSAPPPKHAFPAHHASKNDLYRCLRQHDCSSFMGLRQAAPR